MKSSAAVLLCSAASRHFAVVFGNGRYLLDPQRIEQRFGLLVTLNTVDPLKVKSIDKASLDRQGMQSRIQASRDASTKDFGLDIEQDLVRAVAGTPIDGLLGRTIAGFDSLHVAARTTLDDLRERLATYLKNSQQTLYQKEFGWIDHVREVRDPKMKERLTGHLIKDLKTAGSIQCWLAPDGIIDWNEVSYFQFGGAQSAPRFSNLALDRFIKHIGGRKKLNLAVLENTRVRALRADDSIAHEWTAARCMQSEMPFSQKNYLLSSGKWYQVDDEFVAAIDKIVDEIPTLPSPDIDLPEYNDLKEGDYNARAADASGNRLALVDAQNVPHGGRHSLIEFCDLYSLDRDLIHVKRYSGSAVLSHLFSQATVSGQLFKSDAEFRSKVNVKLPATHRIPDTASAPAQGFYRVVIAIVGGPGSCVKLPFFSRVTLKNSFRLLSAYGYRVAVSHVPFEAQFEQLSAIRTKAKRGRKRRRLST